MSEKDSVLRVMTDDGAFRVITARTTKMVRQAITAQGVSGSAARFLGDLLTGSVLFRQTMAPQLRVQSIIKTSDGRASLVADSHPSGKTRGLIQSREGEALDLQSGALLQVMRSMPDGRIHQGVVRFKGGVSEALMEYMQVSEQVTTTLAVGTLINEQGGVDRAGGYIVQLLPEVDRGPLAVMTERLSGLDQIETQLSRGGFSHEALLDELLYGMPFTKLEECDVNFGCWCNRYRVMSALSTLSRADLQHLMHDGKVLEICCDYCHREYRVPPAQLQGLLDVS